MKIEMMMGPKMEIKSNNNKCIKRANENKLK